MKNLGFLILQPCGPLGAVANELNKPRQMLEAAHIAQNISPPQRGVAILGVWGGGERQEPVGSDFPPLLRTRLPPAARHLPTWTAP